MPRNPELTPSPIVDKNGKQTTVYRRDDNAQKQSGRTIPSPAANDTAYEMKQLRSSIAHDLCGIELQYADSKRGKGIKATLYSMDLDALRSLYQTAQDIIKMDEENHTRFPAADDLRQCIATGDTTRIDIIKNYGNKISGHLDMSALIRVVEQLKSMDTDTESFTTNAEAHIYAAGLYVSKHGTPDYYERNENFIRFINKHPEHVDDAYQFREERALKEFDDAVFTEWRKEGALRDGVL